MKLKDVKIGGKYRVTDKWSCQSFCSKKTADHIVITEIDEDNNLFYNIKDKAGEKLSSCWNCFKPEHLIPYEKTLDDVEEGDVLVDVCGVEYTVIGRAGLMVWISNSAIASCSYTAWTIPELKKDGFTIKQDTASKKTINVNGQEFTVDELNDLIKKA